MKRKQIRIVNMWISGEYFNATSIWQRGHQNCTKLKLKSLSHTRKSFRYGEIIFKHHFVILYNQCSKSVNDIFKALNIQEPN